MNTPIFSRHHYEAIAATLLDAKTNVQDYASKDYLWLRLRAGFMSLFMHDNPNFKPNMFLKATEGGKADDNETED